jgi:hypothetical protein
MYRLFILFVILLSMNSVSANSSETVDNFKYSSDKVIFEITKAGHVTASYHSEKLGKREIGLQVIRGEQNDLCT